MKVGFEVGDQEEADEPQPGYAESAETKDDWSSWFVRVTFDFLLVYGVLALAKDVFKLFRRR